MAARSKPAGKRGLPLWLQGLACGAALALAPAAAAFAAVLTLPALLVWAADPAPGKPTARPVILLGIATTIRPLADMWRQGAGLARVAELAGNPKVLAIAWAAQGLAWLFMELAPLCINLSLEAAAQARAMRLRTARSRYEAEWEVPPLPAAPP